MAAPDSSSGAFALLNCVKCRLSGDLITQFNYIAAQNNLNSGMKNLLYCSLLILILPACNNSEKQLLKRAEKIHEKVLTVDTHCDTPMDMVRSDFDLGQRHSEGCVDFPRMAEGGLDAEFFAVFTSQGPRNDSAYKEVYSYALEVLETIHSNVEKNSDVAGIAITSDDAYKLKKAGRIAAFIGIENGYPVGKDISGIREFYDRGARYITLSHTRNNDICDSSTDPKGTEHNGLSSFGREEVKEMNRLGMMIDVSHISDKAFYDVIQLSSAPVIASHSSCRALCESPRNLNDDMLLALKENGGVIQICILSEYIKTPDPNPELDAKLRELRGKYGDYANLPDDKKKEMRSEYRVIQDKYEKLATVKDVVDHLDHVIQVIGVDYVGIGTDFDGGGGVEGCKTVADMKNITIELLRRGYKKADIAKIWGGNIMRVLNEVEQKKEIPA
jgi:membrane dipeptidase